MPLVVAATSYRRRITGRDALLPSQGAEQRSELGGKRGRGGGEEEGRKGARVEREGEKKGLPSASRRRGGIAPPAQGDK